MWLGTTVFETPFFTNRAKRRVTYFLKRWFDISLKNKSISEKENRYLASNLICFLSLYSGAQLFARKQKLGFWRDPFLLLISPLKRWVDVCDITGLLWKCLFHRGFRPQVGNLTEEVWTLGKHNWSKQKKRGGDSIWKNSQGENNIQSPITGCFEFSYEGSHACQCILQRGWYFFESQFYLL